MFQLVVLADAYKCLCRVEECGKEFSKPETRTALLSLASSCRADSQCISVCRAIRNLTLSTAGQRLFSQVEVRDGFLCMAACISSDDGREAWARAICRCERAGLQAAAPVVFFGVFSSQVTAASLTL